MFSLTPTPQAAGLNAYRGLPDRSRRPSNSMPAHRLQVTPGSLTEQWRSWRCQSSFKPGVIPNASLVNSTSDIRWTLLCRVAQIANQPPGQQVPSGTPTSPLETQEAEVEMITATGETYVFMPKTEDLQLAEPAGENAAAETVPLAKREDDSEEQVVVSYDDAVAFFSQLSCFDLQVLNNRSSYSLTHGSAAGEGEPHDDLAFVSAYAAACTDMLVAYFRDARSVFNSWESGLCSEFVRLPAAAVHQIMTSSKFGTDNEDTMVALLCNWLDFSTSHGPPVEARDAQLLRTCIRACQLSEAYIQTVLSKPDCVFRLSDDERALLACAKALGPGRMRAEAADDDGAAGGSSLATSAALQVLPNSWLNTARRPLPADAASQATCLSVTITKQDLHARFSGCKLKDSPAGSGPNNGPEGPAANDDEHDMVCESGQLVVALGHGLRLAVMRDPASGNGLLGCLQALPYVFSLIESEVRSYWQFDVAFEVIGKGGACISRVHRPRLTSLCSKLACVPLFTFPPDKPLTEVASWEELLLDDKEEVTINCTIKPVASCEEESESD